MASFCNESCVFPEASQENFQCIVVVPVMTSSTMLAMVLEVFMALLTFEKFDYLNAAESIENIVGDYKLQHFLTN